MICKAGAGDTAVAKNYLVLQFKKNVEIKITVLLLVIFTLLVVY